MRLVCLAILVLTSTTACLPRAPTTGRPCPCATGEVCCDNNYCAIDRASCGDAEPSVSPAGEPEPSVSPEPSASPEPSVSPEPSPTPEPTPTPTPEPSPAPEPSLATQDVQTRTFTPTVHLRVHPIVHPRTIDGRSRSGVNAG